MATSSCRSPRRCSASASWPSSSPTCRRSTGRSAAARRSSATLEVRAGLPPSPAELLTRYARIGWLDSLDEELFPSWERWFAEIEESHTSQACAELPAVAPPGAELDHRRRLRARHRGHLQLRHRQAPRRPRRPPAPQRVPLPAAHRRLLRHPLRPRPPPGRSHLGHAGRVRPPVRRAGGGRRPAEGGPRPGLAGLRGLAGELRRRAGGAVRARDGTAGGLVERPAVHGSRAAASRSPAGPRSRASDRDDVGWPSERDTAPPSERLGHCAAAQNDTPRRPARAGTGTSMSHRGAGPWWGRISTSPHRKPATRPPMWPPIEMPGMANVSTRLMMRSPPRLVRMIGDLADDHAGDRAAHEAEGHAGGAGGDGTGVVGEQERAGRAADQAREVGERVAHRSQGAAPASARPGRSRACSWPRWSRPKCRNPLVKMRHHSPPASMRIGLRP